MWHLFGMLTDGIWGDLRFGVRSLARTPGFALTCIVTLGLGISATTSAFSVLNTVMLRPLPYPDSQQLDRIYRVTPQNARGGVSPADFIDVRAEASGYGDIAAYGASEMSLSAPGEPAEMARGLRVSSNLFDVLRIEPGPGRGFREDEGVPGNDRVLVISHRFWQNRFGGDPFVLGRAVRVNGEAHAIVGVLPETANDWRHLGPFDLYQPLALTDAEASDRHSTRLQLVGRRASSVPPAEAAAVIAGFGRRLAVDFPAVHAGTDWRTQALNGAVAPNRPGIFAMLIGLALLVLLIACSNLANLLLARTMARGREIAVRAALGASRARLVRSLCVESLALALAGGAAAVYFALWINDWMREVSPGGVFEVPIDWRVLGWTFGAALFTALVFGVAPALFAMRLDLNDTLKSGGRGTTGGRGHQRFRSVLIVGQFALAMVLLAGAAVFIRGIHEANTRQHGWNSDGLVTGSLLLPSATYPRAEDVIDFQRLALERLTAVPGVASASVSYTLPFFGLTEPRRFLVRDREAPEPGREPVAAINGVTPGYFDTVGTRVIEGRSFDERDTITSPKVYVVNGAMARGLFGDEGALGRHVGRHLDLTGEGVLEWGEIVGVVADVQSIHPDRIDVPYQLYHPLAQEPRHGFRLAVRTAGAPPEAVVGGIRSAMAALDPDLPVRELQPAATTIAAANYQWQVLGSVLAFLAVLGLGLAALGVYGIVARTVAQRRGEFGIRLALGALAGDIVRLVLASGARLALLGSAIGLIGAFGLSRVIVALFPNLQPDGAPVVGGVALLLTIVALLACYFPARHASRIDPIQTLRME